MYPSNSFYPSSNNNNENLASPFYTLDQTLADNLSIYEINPNSKQGNSLHNPLYYNIPSPYIHYKNDDDVFVQHMYDLYLPKRSQITEINAPDPIRLKMVEYSDNIEEILGECSSKENESVVIKEITEKKTPKKDRHSKIETAQGPRDRRVRLSLQVARDFFDLQDTLGFNRASKTVEWLLSKSKAAIKDLTSSTANSPSSTFECQDVSQETEKHLFSTTKETKNTRGSTRKPAFNPFAKESREKARARARERTRGKIKMDVLEVGSETTMINQMNPLGSWCQNQNNFSQLEVFDDVGAPSSSTILNFHMLNNGIFQEHQFIDFNLQGKPWDVYGNTNLR